MNLQLVPIAINYADKKIYHLVDDNGVFLEKAWIKPHPLEDIKKLFAEYIELDTNWVQFKLVDLYKNDGEFALYGVLLPISTPIKSGKWANDDQSLIVNAVRRAVLNEVV